MDPLTISTSIITILHAATAIITVCYNARAALKDDSWALAAIIKGLKDIRNIFEGLDEITQRSNNIDGLKGFRAISNDAVESCRQELSLLDKTIRASFCANAKGSKKRAMLQALHWQLKDKDARECLERIERCKSALGLALGRDQLSVEAWPPMRRNLADVATAQSCWTSTSLRQISRLWRRVSMTRLPPLKPRCMNKN